MHRNLIYSVSIDVISTVPFIVVFSLTVPACLQLQPQCLDGLDTTASKAMIPALLSDDVFHRSLLARRPSTPWRDLLCCAIIIRQWWSI